ncbi:MAG TPA: hypothetical protein VFT12_10000 [Thermoanaerobaculia bacterium]|nr:hypothetical protein [Thermoanaerobaculia bacterium]
MDRLLQHFEEPVAGGDGQRYVVYVHGRSRPGDTWQGWLVFERQSDGLRFETPVETTQPSERDVIHWASALSSTYFEGALARALRGSLPRVAAAPAPAPLIDRGVDHATLESRRGAIQQEILSLFRKVGEHRLLTRDIFAALPYGHADIVRAIDDLEKTQRTVVRRTEEGNDWLFLTRG